LSTSRHYRLDFDPYPVQLFSHVNLAAPVPPPLSSFGGNAMTIADSITASSALIAALSFAFGVSAWKREYVGKRRIELAETTLAKFYEAAAAIRTIRSPFGRSDEGKSRQRDSSETPESSAHWDRAHVAFERYEQRSALFNEIASMKYRFMTAFGKAAGAPFDELHAVVNEIFISARMLADVYWPRQGSEMSERAREIHLRDLEEHQAIFWLPKASDDKIAPRVEAIIREIEEITQLAVSGPPSWRRRAWQWTTRGAEWPATWRRSAPAQRSVSTAS
jgi:hypothetical protein